MTVKGAQQRELDEGLVKKAVSALIKYHNKSIEESKSLLGNDLAIQVQIGLEVAPGQAKHKPIRVSIPHPIHNFGDDDSHELNLEEAEVCLIVKDESKPAIQKVIAEFPKELGCIKKVLGLESLRKKHGSSQQKRDLLARFTVFLADDRILPMLGSALGKIFYKTKKLPIPIPVTSPITLPIHVMKALKATYMHIPEGTCITIKAGYTNMDTNKLIDNIISICNNAIPYIPRKWANIRCISIKTPKSTSLPIYNQTPAELIELAKLAGLPSAWTTTKQEESNKKRKSIDEKTDETNNDNQELDKTNKSKPAKSPLLRALKKQKKMEKDTSKDDNEKQQMKDSIDDDNKEKTDNTGSKKHNKKKKDDKTKDEEIKSDKKKKRDRVDSIDESHNKDSKSKEKKSERKMSVDKNEEKVTKDDVEQDAANNDNKSSGKKKHSKKRKESIDESKENKSEKEKDNKQELKSITPKETNKKKKRSGEEEKTSKESSTKKRDRKKSIDETADDNKETKKHHDKKSKKEEKESSTKEGEEKKSKKTANEDSSSADFIPSKKYKGSKEGYVFKKDNKGVGYYLDVPPVVDKMAMEALARLASNRSPKGRSGGKGKKGRRHRSSY